VPLNQYFRDGLSILIEPSVFFKTRYPDFSLSQSLALGITVSWVSAIIDAIIHYLRPPSHSNAFDKAKDLLSHLPLLKNMPKIFWTQSFETNAWLKLSLYPFQALLTFFMYGFIFYWGARAFGSKGVLRDTVKITAIASAAHLVSSICFFLPYGLTSLIGWLFYIGILTCGFTLVLNISRVRAILVTFLPSLITLILFLGFAVLN